MNINKRKTNRKKGFTIIELMIATGLASTVVVGVGMLLVDSQRGWNRMYSRTYSDISTDSHVARRRFDSTVRNASTQGILLAADGSWVEVYYYSDPNSTIVDRYARFFTYGDGPCQLLAEHGAVEPRQILNTETICGNVTSCVFKSAGNSAQMILTLDDGSQSATIVASAVMHNR
ncbi:MAG: prepilin-type N-terminal cleavage/methylation domain-containing protein [Planctomycetota bacterium]|jgi:type II secretory pathway pseudopilin PulG